MDEMNLQYLEKLKKNSLIRFLIFTELEGGVVGGRGVQGGGGTTPLPNTLIQACPPPHDHGTGRHDHCTRVFRVHTGHGRCPVPPRKRNPAPRCGAAPRGTRPGVRRRGRIGDALGAFGHGRVRGPRRLLGSGNARDVLVGALRHQMRGGRQGDGRGRVRELVLDA